MSEDKMREKFENLVANYPYKRPVDRNGLGYVNDSVFLAYESWKTCEAIKDAEIAAMKENWQELRNVLEQTQKSLVAAEKEIAARDLMIKELREAALRVQESPYSGSGIEFVKAMQQLKEALAKSEHHNSRALEKMLLEARISEMTYIVPEHRNSARLHELKVKLAELNKE